MNLGAFENERELEQVLEEQVSLLQASDDVRLMFVARQVHLPTAGTLDLLCIDESGLPIAVEVKLARNGESRREVAAQIIDYLSDLATLPVQDLDRAVDGAIEAALRRFDPDNDERFEERWELLDAKLREGRTRMVVVLDDVRPDLKRIFEFLRDQSLADVRLVTVSKFEAETTGTIYIPTVVVSAPGRRQSGPAQSQVQIAPEDFAVGLEHRNPGATTAWRGFVAELTEARIPGLEIGHYRSGAPEISVRHPTLGSVSLIRLNQNGAGIKDNLNDSVWESTPGLQQARDTCRRFLLDNVPGAEVRGTQGRVAVPIGALASHVPIIVTALKDVAAELDRFRPSPVGTALMR